HNIPSVLPQNPPPMTMGDKALEWEDWTRQYLKSAGYTEFYGYSFVSREILEKYDISPESALVLHNPLSSELTHLRTSLMPSVLKDIEINQGETPNAEVFELARIYPTVENDLPNERTELVIAEYGKIDAELAFLRLKGLVEDIAKKTGLHFVFVRENDDAHWHAYRSARIMLGGVKVGVIGQVDKEYTDAFKIDNSVFAVQMDWEKVMQNMHLTKRYKPLPDFPGVHRDISIDVEESLEFENLYKSILDQSALIVDARLKDVYRGKGIASQRKSITLSITLRSEERTLLSEEVDSVMKNVSGVLIEKFDAIIR
ncbi:hypothetical protein KJ766_01625, partial [Patescibacteria group bacterium]|nr:hypothetical protein [Patescibacteria group bacterium]